MKLAEWVIVSCIAILLIVLFVLFVWFINVDAQSTLPKWDNIYCQWGQSNYGYMRIRWDNPPELWKANKKKPGYVFIEFGGIYVKDYKLYLITDTKEEKVWGTLWTPEPGKMKISGYIRAKNGNKIHLPVVNKRCPQGKK